MTKEEELRVKFTARRQLQDYIEHNRAEVKRLKEAALIEENERNYALIMRSIRRGEGLISTQKTELMKMSMQKIADDVGMDRSAVSRRYLSNKWLVA